MNMMNGTCGMLLYNDVGLEDVAPVRVVDVVVSPIKQAVTTVKRASMPGEDFVRIRGETRTITVTFALLENDRDARRESMETVRRWAAGDRPGRLMLPDRIGQYIEAVCTTFPQLSVREWWEVCQMVFTAYDPFFVSAAENSSACGTPFMALGSQPPKMQIRATLSAAVDNPSWTNGKQTISLTGSIGPGALVIDLDKQTITLNGASIMSAYAFPASDFIVPALGYNNIKGTGRVYWRERWE